MIIFVDCLLLVLNVLLERKKNPDAGILLNYDDDGFSQGFNQPKEKFRALQKDNILQPFFICEVFRFSDTVVDEFERVNLLTKRSKRVTLKRQNGSSKLS